MFSRLGLLFDTPWRLFETLGPILARHVELLGLLGSIWGGLHEVLGRSFGLLDRS
jgi:hypothetical protein